MKRQSIFIGTIIAFYSTACSTPSIPTKTASTHPKLVQKEEQGGNPEVYNIHQCLKLKNRAEVACFNKLFPHKTYLVLHPSSGEPLILAGRGDSVEKRTIELKAND